MLGKKLILLIVVLIIISCEKEELPTRTESNLVQNLTSGPWEISYLALDGIDRGQEYEGIDFTFLANGQVEAYRETQLLQQGLWSTSVVSGRIEIQTSFSSVPMFENLNAVWYQASVGPNRILLRKIDSDSEDYVLFVKR